MQRKFSLVCWPGIVVAVFGLSYDAPAAPKPDSPAIAEVLRIDQARLAAMMAGDGVALGRVFSDEVIFTHSDGRVEAKADYIKNMTAGDTAYKDVKTSDLTARQIAADVIVLAGGQEMKKKLGPTWSEIKLRFMSVWRNEAGTWRMIAWQSMKPSGNSVVPPKG
jgi:hypothetical protein